MCKFCEGIFKEGCKMQWNMRSSYADDNFCDKVMNSECGNCEKCSMEYKPSGFMMPDTKGCYIDCEYKFDNGNIVMWNFTEPLRINYCPFCGKALSDEMVDMNDISSHICDIVDNNEEAWDYDEYSALKIKADN